MKKTRAIATFFIAASALAANYCYSMDSGKTLDDQHWIHGSEACANNTDEPIQVVQYDTNTWILRQNKCSNYEAPFLYLFIGRNKALLMDTGATKDENQFPIYKTVSAIINSWQVKQNRSVELIVAHTHKHGDHYAGDDQFRNKANTTLVNLEVDDVKTFFGMSHWPEKIASFDLGDRTLKIIPIPGHQEASIAIYDSSSKLLLTGDTFYPGRLYVNDWSSFRQSIQRLTTFTENNEIAYILGNHIEMSAVDGVDYPMGTTYQPNEQKLPLTVADLQTLNFGLQALGDQPARKTYSHFIIYPTD